MLAAVSLTLPFSVVNAEDVQSENKISGLTLEQQKIQENSSRLFLQEQENAKNERLELYEQIKNDPDFEIFADDGNGTFAYTNSSNLKSEDDKVRFLQKAEQIEAQKSVKGYKKIDKLNGYMENSIQDTVSLDKPWFGGDQTLVFSGTNTVQWFKEKSKYENWNKLSGINDVFTVGYSYVSSTTSGVSVGVESGVVPTPVGNASYSWTKTNTSATQSFGWPDKGPYFYYGKTYGDFQVKTEKITNYTHSSSAVANVGGENILINATANTTF